MATYRFYDKYAAGIEGVISDITSDSLRVYPSPVVDEMTIELTEAINTIAIYNLSGSIVIPDYSVIDGNRAQVDVSSLSAGLYIVKINNNIVGKFIKK